MSNVHARLMFVVAVTVLAAATPSFAGFAGTELYLPAVGGAPGVPPAVWSTTVWVHNPNATRADVTFYLLERQANPSPQTATDSIPPGDTRRYDNAVATLFGFEGFGGLRITSNVKVSWQVTGIRQDAWANAHRVPVEEDKPTEEVGTYLAPEVWGLPEEFGLPWRQEEGIRAHAERAAAERAEEERLGEQR